MENYIKISRKILEWEWYRNGHTKNVFFHCLLKANWKDGRFEGKDIPRGSFVTSVKKLSLELDLTEDEVKTALKHLLKTGEITKQTTNKYTVITVSNYELYQDVTKQIPYDNQTDTELLQNNSHSIAKLLPTIEERKKGRKEEGKKGRREDSITVSNETVRQTDVRQIVDAWNGLEVYGIKPISKLSNDSRRYQRLLARIRQYSTADILAAIDKIRQSGFLQGKNSRGWVITFDWFVLPNNFPKVLEGNYDGGNCGKHMPKSKGFSGNGRNEQFEKLMEQIRMDEQYDSERSQETHRGIDGDVSKL